MCGCRAPGPYPGDDEGHVEVFASLQPEAPWRGATQGDGVAAHFDPTSRELKRRAFL